MGSHLSKGRGVAGFVIAGILLAVAGCQSSDGGNVLNVGDKSEPPTEKVLESELRAKHLLNGVVEVQTARLQLCAERVVDAVGRAVLNLVADL